MTHVNSILMYAVTQRFQTNEGTSAFSGQIYASSLAEASKIAKQMNAELDGIMVESQCTRCGNIVIHNNSFSGVDDSQVDVWDDEIE